ncbi:MAG: SpoIIE family protein phosphatase, partial [Planctomycetota bacterium]|nr:SpoIIE family protein phosphatase [Planctomycetota bacterium]
KPKPKPVSRPKPAAAKPVRPAKPPAAPPVARPAAAPRAPAAKPVAKPVAKPPAGKPVAKPAASKPTAKGPAREGAKGPRRKAAEEEIGGRARGGRGSARPSGGGGMGLGGKVGLIAALVCLLCIGAAVFLSGAANKKENPEAEMNAFGYQAASVLAGPGARYYRGGGGGGATGMGHYEKVVKSLFGDTGGEAWAKWTKELTSPIPREDEGSFAGEKLKERQEAYQKAAAKIRKNAGAGSDGGGGSKTIQKRMATIWTAMDKTTRGRYSVTHGWLTEAKPGGKWLGGNAGVHEVSIDMDKYVHEGNGFGYVDGFVKEAPVRIYTASIRGAKPSDNMTAHVAVYDGGKKSGGSAIGLIMLILGPLLVGFAAYAVANGHTKNVRMLAREIDRLGSSGDPERHLRASGAEANLVARSVERMVGNLEFREKHDGADLEEVVSKEQKVAEEIHGALTNRHPPRLDGYEVETLFKPGFEIGGDHFEYFRIDETHLGIMMLDTNVRGITATLVMASTKAYVRAEAPGVLSPAEVLKKVNRHLAGELPAGRHVTGLYVVLNTADGSAMVASAGHLPLLVYRHQAGKLAKVNPEGIALGLDKGPVFESSLQEGDIPLGVGDRIVMYTDGALRVQNEDGEEYGEQRFYGAVGQEAPKNSQAFVNFVGAGIDRFHLQVPQNDDITISTVKRLR